MRETTLEIEKRPVISGNRLLELKKSLDVARRNTILINMVGATIIFIYYAFIESGFHNTFPVFDSRTKFLYFLFRLATGAIVVLLLVRRLLRPLRKGFADNPDGLDRITAIRTRSQILNLPLTMALVSMLGWVTTGFLTGLLPHTIGFSSVWHLGWHSFVGIAFIGAPFSTILVYFVLEWKLRERVEELFPQDLLLSTPAVRKISVLTKMVLVLIMVGTVPVTAVSYITLSRIHEVNSGRQDVAGFISQMPVVIGSLLFFAVSTAVGLSVLLAWSFSRPLSSADIAMEKVRKGDLSARIPVLSNDEIGAMGEVFNRMVAGLRERDYIRETFGSYLSPEVVAAILKSPDGVNLGGELREVTILVSDLRGFTALTASLEPSVVLKIVNGYLECMVEIIMKYGGTIDEFTGDGILAFFGAPKRLPNSQELAVRCALDMQSSMGELNRRLAPIITASHPASLDAETRLMKNILGMGIGINSGELIVGNIGSEKRKKYGAVGNAINVAFRVEKLTVAGDIIITPEVYGNVAHFVSCREIPNVELKGIPTPLTLYQVTGFVHS